MASNLRPIVLSTIALVPSVHGQSTLDPALNDSLWAVWNDPNQPDSNKLKAMYDIAWDGYLFSQPDSAHYYSGLQLELARESGQKRWEAKAWNLRGVSFFYRGDYPRGLECLTECLQIQEALGDDMGIAITLGNIGNIHRDLGEHDQALAHHQRALSISERVHDSTGIAVALNNMGGNYEARGDYARAIDHYMRSLRIKERLGDERGIGNTLNNIGVLRMQQKDYAEAMSYFLRSKVYRERLADNVGLGGLLANMAIVEEHSGSLDSARTLNELAMRTYEEAGHTPGLLLAGNNLGSVLLKKGDAQGALREFQRCFQLADSMGDKGHAAIALSNMGSIHAELGDRKAAMSEALRAMVLAQEAQEVVPLRDASDLLFQMYKATGRFKEALEMKELTERLRDSLDSEENHREVMRQGFRYDFEKMEAATKAEQEKKDIRQRNVRNSLTLGLALMIVFAGVFFYQRNSIAREKQRSDELLLNILPEEVADELKAKGHADAKHFDNATILFTDFKGFTQLSEQVSPGELVAELNACFKVFDGIMENYRIEKIKTIGDAYMAAGGLPDPQHGSPADVIRAALEMQDFMKRHKAEREAQGKPFFEMRVGIHTGPVVAGIVGVKKFQYDIWGDTVNTASRMESSGEVGQVNISEATYRLVNGEGRMANGTNPEVDIPHPPFTNPHSPAFVFTPRGKIQAKGKGEMEMYFVGPDRLGS